jgi:preprotein translocase subunit SecA
MFLELVDRIKFESLKTLHLVQLRDEEEERERERMQQILNEMQLSNEDMELLHESTLEPEEKKPFVAPKKIPRNAPCPCGSGKKYKNCCGKSGPKKGALAQSEE